MMELPSMLKATMLQANYFSPGYIQDRGICALTQMAFTTALVVGISPDGSFYESRYYYSHSIYALKALDAWDGIGDPPGNWIKHKGGPEGDRSNPNTANEVFL